MQCQLLKSPRRQPPKEGSGKCTTSSLNIKTRLMTPVQAFAFADLLGLDIQRMQLEVAQHVYQNRIREDFLGGVRSGVNGTPTFYVNGFRHDGEPVAESLIEALTSTR